MKKITLITLFLALTTQLLFSQTNYSYEVTVLNNQGKAYSQVKIWFHNKTTGEKIIKYTNHKGIVNFELTTAGDWTLNLIGMHNVRTVNVKEGITGSGSKLLTYDLERYTQNQNFKRKRNLTKSYVEKDQSKLKIDRIPKGKSKVIIKLKNDDLSKVSNTKIILTSVNPPEKYVNVTNKKGEAIFLVPGNKIYAIDVDEAQNYSFTEKLMNQYTHQSTLEYQPTIVDETNINDTITQNLHQDQKPSSLRAFVELEISDYSNQIVYLTQIGTGKVFSAQTNDEDIASFLIPNGYNYMLDLKYQPNVDVINLDDSYGERTLWKRIIWSPLPILQYPEQFLPTSENPDFIDINNYNTEKFKTDQQVDFFVKWGNNKVNKNAKEAILQLNIVVNDEIISENSERISRKPLNLAFVVDVSGSMAYDFDVMIESMIQFVAQLLPEDNVCLISFNSNAYVEMPLKPIGDGTELKNNISDLECGGGTNIYNGIVLGYAKLLSKYDENKTNTLILLTDGYGSEPVSKVVDKSKEYNKKGIGISAIGIGNYNQSLLTLLTQESNGIVACDKDSENMKNILEIFSQAIFPVATNAKISVEYNNNINFEKLFGFSVFKNVPNTLSINIGELYLGMNKVALMKFQLKNLAQSIDNKPVKIKLTYQNIKEEQVTIEHNIVLNWDTETGKYEKLIENQQKKLYAIAIMNRAIKVMTDQFAMNQPIEAKKTLTDTNQEVLDLYNKKITDKDVAEIYEKISRYIVAIENFMKK